MKIKYAFLDGTVTEVEVSDEVGAVIIDSRKAEHAQDERHHYHCYSYDAIDYEGEEYQMAMALARSMRSKGLISAKEYAKIDTIIANKYGISSCSIFR